MTQQNTQHPSNYDSARRPGGTQVIALIIAWAVVGIPAAWGVAQTVRKSIPLFTAPAAQKPATHPSAS